MYTLGLPEVGKRSVAAGSSPIRPVPDDNVFTFPHLPFADHIWFYSRKGFPGQL